MENKIKTIEIDGVEFSFNANKAFEKNGHVYCRQCGEQIDSEPLDCLGSKKIIFGKRILLRTSKNYQKVIVALYFMEMQELERLT